MKKTLAVLTLGFALSTFSIPRDYASDLNLPKNLFSCSSSADSENNFSSYKDIPHKQPEELILNVFNTLDTIRQLNFVKLWVFNKEFEFQTGVRFNFNGFNSDYLGKSLFDFRTNYGNFKIDMIIKFNLSYKL